MAAPPKCCVVLTCENEFTEATGVRLCGAWVIVTRGEEVPYCLKCKRQQRTWRLVTEPEIHARDEAFLKAVERCGYLGPDAHLGVKE